MNSEIFNKTFEQYREKFGEPFPMMEYMSADDSEIHDMMVECIRENKPAGVLYPISKDYKY